MSIPSIYLTCSVRKADGTPVLGIQIRSFCLANPATVYHGYSDSSGEVKTWCHQDDMNQPKFWLYCPEDSDWRVLFDLPSHAFRGISIDLHISGNANANANITATIAPGIIALSNESFKNTPQFNQFNGVSDLDAISKCSGPRLMGRRNSSSLGSISDISSFILNNDIPLGMDTDSRIPPRHSSQYSIGGSEAGGIVLEKSDRLTLGFQSWDSWFDTFPGEEEQGIAQGASVHKIKKDEGDLTEDSNSTNGSSNLKG